MSRLLSHFEPLLLRLLDSTVLSRSLKDSYELVKSTQTYQLRVCEGVVVAAQRHVKLEFKLLV